MRERFDELLAEPPEHERADADTPKSILMRALRLR